MGEAPRSNRPTPRTPAAIEAELRRRIRAELESAREEADGELDDASLAAIIARAVASGLGWHLEAPEHTRNATLSSRSWRPAPGPRGPRPRDFEQEPFEDRGSRPPPRRGFQQRQSGQRSADDTDFRGPRSQRPFGPRGGGVKRGGGGFGPRRPSRGR